MTFNSILIANRGEIAVRIARAAADLGIRTVAVYSGDDAASLHVRSADSAQALGADGPAAYLDIARVIAAAKSSHCEAVHPGYGFLSENALFAEACEKVGLTFIGPSPKVLAIFGDKARARDLAGKFGVPVLAGTPGPATLEQTRAFFRKTGGAIIIKAIAGGGGRGMRIVTSEDEIESAYARCQSEALAGFGNAAVYAEALMPGARHVEVQVAGDGKSASHVWERDCTLQRRHQKIVEIAPAPGLDPDLGKQLRDAAVWLADDVNLKGLATFEFLVDPNPPRHGSAFAFIEANPRLQVEHTVTEEVTGIDLVGVQIELARGRSLREIGLHQDEVPPPRGTAVQLRINMEKIAADGTIKPSGGTLTRFVPPSGPGVRVDTFGYEGYKTNPAFDPLLAKLIVHGPDYGAALARARRALSEFVIEGVATNIAFLHELISREDVAAGHTHTRYVEEHTADLVAAAANWRPAAPMASTAAAPVAAAAAAPAGTVAVAAPMQGKIVSIDVAPGDAVRRGAAIAVLESMKMEHLVAAAVSGRVHSLAHAPGTVLFEGDALLFLTPEEVGGAEEAAAVARDPDVIRPDLAESNARHAFSLDENRPDAVARRRKTGQRTARENLAQLCDKDSFIEYGALAFAAQRRRRSLDDLIKNTPGDGIITGIGTVNAAEFGEAKARCAIMAYDYTVLAGTQGSMNHQKKDRLLKVAEEWKLPIICFAEGGGGRPGDTDYPGVAGLDTPTFRHYAKLSGLMPRIGINSGRCFAGNAALLGTSDVIIATANSNIGMGGPAMIEGGGLGVYRPEDVGPMSVQVPNGVVDIAVADEIEAIAVAKKYLAYFQGPLTNWDAANQKELRHLIPENRLRVYESRKVIAALADTGSVLELRPDFAPGMLTALIRIEGAPFGLIANNPMHLAGAIDGPCADKAARFLQLCDAFGLPIVSLCDTPGFMVGPEHEKTALVRHVSRMFVVGGSLSVPIFTVVLRKGYGLGAQAMAGGSFHAPFFIVSWPTGEFGGMGLEGAARLGYRKELEAEPTPEAKEELFKKLVAQSYARGKAINMAAYLEIDDVIDPADTRRWILRGYRSLPPHDASKRRAFLDTW
ncbi:MAG TPA: carboxyl transferase domain-containing protein [Rhizomicrobium sp.]|jgi:acetyl/propionyl-CoA carboxylase alpha subunit|nr:carboxyl transferase domain-containing protein [Rhizomicrobium sp.]